MGKQTNAYKQRWEAEHYKQVKISVRRELAEAFKATCEAAGVSAAGEISAFMAGRCGMAAGTETAIAHGNAGLRENKADDLSSKKKRRAALKKLLQQLEKIRDAQSTALENIPENLQGSEAYENAEESLSLIEEAIETLAEVY